MGKTLLDRAMPKRMAAVVAVWAVVLGQVPSVSAYTTTSPAVRQMVDRAIGYLETAARGEDGWAGGHRPGLLEEPVAARQSRRGRGGQGDSEGGPRTRRH